MVWRWLALALVTATPGAANPGVKTFGKWTAGCDNENVCTAIHPAWNSGDVPPEIRGTPFLQIRHHPQRDAIPQISLLDPANQAPRAVLRPPLVTMVFQFNAKSGVGNALAYPAVVDGDGGYRFEAEDTRSIIYGLRKSKRVAVSIDDQRGFSFDPAPFEEVLAFFDRQQELEGTPGALVLLPGDEVMNDYAHPVPPEADTVELTPFSQQQLQHWQVEYPERKPNEVIDVETYPARGIVVLIRAKTPARDCGVFERWGHTGTGTNFVLVERREMPVCNGIAQQHWIQTYRANSISPQ